jgi:SAM-dependent methyltransferase
VTQTPDGQAPLPPAELADRALTAGAPDPLRRLDDFGRRQRAAILDVLPPGWSFRGKRVLDFGCGPGTLLRHFLDDAGGAEFHGCDIDEPSIAWLERNLSPPLRVFRSGSSPPLPLPDGYFDLVFAMGVFAQITDQWSAWLVELHRVLADGGLMIATVMSEGISREFGESWRDERFGMYVIDYGATWDRDGHGPMVLHSAWWLERHWGRIFDVEVCGELLTDVDQGRHTVLKLRRKPRRLTAQELERPGAGEPREATAMQHQLIRLRRELAAYGGGAGPSPAGS